MIYKTVKLKLNKMKNIQTLESKQSEITINRNLLIAISNDTLILMKSKTEFDKYLIEGKNPNAYLVEGETKDIVNIIHNFYNARETKTPYIFEIDNIYFNFL